MQPDILDPKVIIGWLTLLTMAIGALTWYVRQITKDAISQAIKEISERYATREHVGYVEGMLRESMKGHFAKIDGEFQHLGQLMANLRADVKELKPSTKF